MRYVTGILRRMWRARNRHRLGLAVIVLHFCCPPAGADTLGEMARQGPTIERGAIAHLVAQYDGDLKRCARGPFCSLPVSFFAKIDALRGLQPWEQLRQVDAWVNAFPYRTVDGSGDTVASFLARGGSCKEYVLTKLVMLRDLGFKLVDLWPAHVIVPDGSHHEILLVKIDGVLMVLTNSSSADVVPSMLAMSPYNDYPTVWIVRLPEDERQIAGDSAARQCG